MKKIYFREKYLRKIRGFYHDTEMIKVITGVRRCGKSTLLEMIAEELLKDDVKKENIVFIHLDKRPYSRVSKPEVLEEISIQRLNLLMGQNTFL